MKHLLKIFLIAVAVVTAIPSFAVTDKEMEQARALAAKHYLRYANNGSDYLDKLNPSSMSELTGSLKAKEKENIKSFNAVAVPKDYASWDKAKLVQYWSSTFFKSPGLKEDGKKCLGILAKNLQKINVGATSQVAATVEQPAEQSVEKPSEKAAPAVDAKTEAVTTNEVATTNDAQQDMDETEVAITQAEADAGLAEEKPRESSNTTLYIIILVVLVIGVIWLVVYASKSMKETGANLSDHKAGEKEIRETKRAAKEELNKMRDQYANSLTSKNDEIKQLRVQCESLETELDAAKRENAAMRRELDSARHKISSIQAQGQNPAPRPHQEASSTPVSEKPQHVTAKQPGLPPVIYMGQVNDRGLFVKASRSLNPDSTVYVMDIPDGHHGTFRVVDNSKILDRILSDVDVLLANGCEIENPEDADIAVEIVTLQSGEAIFTGNTCRVTKKARIKFI